MAEEGKNDSLVCVQCGTEVSLDKTVCPSCGSDRHLLQSEPGGGEVPSESIRKPRKRPGTLGGLAIIVLVAFAIILINAANRPIAGEDRSTDAKIAGANPAVETTGDIEEEIVSDLGTDEPSDFEGLVADGSWYSSRGEWRKAVTAYEKALAIENDNIKVIRDLITAYLELDDADNALFHLNRWTELDPDDPKPHSLMGSVFYGEGALEEAKCEYDLALSLAGDGDGMAAEYSDKLREIDKKITEERNRVKEEVEASSDDGWVKEEMPEPKPKYVPDQAKEKPEGGITPFSQFFNLQEEKPKSGDGYVLIGEGAVKAEETPESDAGEIFTLVDSGEDDEPAVKGKGEMLVSEEVAVEETKPASVIKVTGARFEATDTEFNLYLDTLGRVDPRCYYEEDESVLWLTIPHADCDFTVVPRERTFIHPFVELIKAWPDSEGNVRFKIILKGPIKYSAPTVMGLGLSLRLRKADSE